MGQVHKTALKIIEEVENTDGLDIFGMLNNSIRIMANSIMDDDEEWEHFIEHISEGNDPTQHILYHASFATGNFNPFKKYVKKYFKKEVSSDEEFVEELFNHIERIESFFKILEENNG